MFGRPIRSRRPPADGRDDLYVVLRPEALRIAPRSPGDNPAAGETAVPARVVSLAYIGPLARYTVAVDGPEGQVLTVDLYNPGPDEFFAEGTPVALHLPADVPSLLS
jgi:hypothetical protein